MAYFRAKNVLLFKHIVNDSSDALLIVAIFEEILLLFVVLVSLP